MNILDPTTAILLLEGVMHLLVAGLVLRRRTFKERTPLFLFLTVVLGLLWVASLIAPQLEQIPFVLPQALLDHVPLYGPFVLSFISLHLARSFLRLEGGKWPMWAVGGGWIAVAIVLDVNPFAVPDTVAPGVQREQIVWGMLLLGWALAAGGTAVMAIKVYRRTVQPLHKNRITYWFAPLLLAIGGGALCFGGRDALGSAIYLLSTPLAAYAALTHQLPDIRQAIRQALSYLLVTVLALSLYVGGFVGVQSLFYRVPGYQPLFAGAAVALILAFLFHPMRLGVRWVVNHLIARQGYNAGRIVHAYSERISNILDMERLSEVIVGVISEALGIERGMLFLVEHPEVQEGEPDVYRLRSVEADGAQALTGVLSADSPIVRHICETCLPLTQYAVDLNAQFQHTPAEERAWWSDLDMDVYVPIFTQEEWSGLLALGPKVSGDRYFDEDLDTLETLANQTAVALENARLVEDLVRLNADLKRAYETLEQMYKELDQAYADLEQANQQLQEMDNLKSAFIGVVTHELRSPFANLNFSVQLIERYGLEEWLVEQREQLEQLKEGLQEAKQMVDNLVTFATFLSKQGELTLDWLELDAVIEDALLPLKPLAENKGIALETEIQASLPRVHGDADRLSDAVYHLTQNAIKFTQDGGEVGVRCWTKEDAVRFQVRDTGIGIPEEKLPTLWDAFAQMADPLKRGVEGLGLGLALVKYVALAHGGEVWAESAEGRGSTFGFSLPLNGQAQREPPALVKETPEPALDLSILDS